MCALYKELLIREVVENKTYSFSSFVHQPEFLSKKTNMSTSSTTMPESRYAVRSISMPARPHPNIPKIEAELRKLKLWEESSTTLKAETICVGLAGVGDLYNCVEELLRLPVTQQSLIHHQNEKWVDDVLDGSVRLLDVCGSARDLLSEMKENTQDLRSALRRRGDKEEKVGSYLCSRKKMKKCINKSVGELKKMNEKFVSSPLDQDEHLKVVIRLLSEVKVITVSVFVSLLAFMSAEPKTCYKWSLVSKLLHKGQVGTTSVEETEDMSEVECVDVAVNSLFRHLCSKDAEMERVKAAQKGLETMERCIEDVEGGLECVSRRLIQTRVTLLNIFTN